MLRPSLWTPPAETIVPNRLENLVTTLQQCLKNITSHFQQVRLASSLAAEDMILTDIIVKQHLPIEIFTLNTGQLNPETQAIQQTAQQHWDIHIATYCPDPDAVNVYLEQHGQSAIYQNITLRRECCRIRKIEPLVRALYQADAWITGQRRSQSATRQQLHIEEYDHQHQLAKFNPLADWQENEVWLYIRKHQLPINTLYQQGYASIGCAPCTRPVKQGENIRAGRWWWENQDTKECGLHQ